MGILNATPDSFYENSRIGEVEDGEARAKKMISDGADILDIGGESTRPGSSGVPVEEELHRVLPLIRRIRHSSDIPISIDTQKSKVAAASIEAGATIINDISAGSFDEDMYSVAASNGVQIVLMHMQGTPQTMQVSPQYRNVLGEIRDYLFTRIDAALAAGISEDNIIIDPGIGFGKRVQDNLDILRYLEEFVSMGFPVLIGLSRKSFLGNILNAADNPGKRLHGSTTCHVWCMQKGVQYLRVHDVKACCDCVTVMSALSGTYESE